MFKEMQDEQNKVARQMRPILSEKKGLSVWDGQLPGVQPDDAGWYGDCVSTILRLIFR
jgi:hypothetical protein